MDDFQSANSGMTHCLQIRRYCDDFGPKCKMTTIVGVAMTSDGEFCNCLFVWDIEVTSKIENVIIQNKKEPL